MIDFSNILSRAVENGLVAAALVEGDERILGLAGTITEDEVVPLAKLVMFGRESDDLGSRLMAGEIVSISLDGRDIALTIAKRQLLVVAVLHTSTAAELELVASLRNAVAERLSDASTPQLWSGNVGGSGSGPAELPLIEFGITVRRDRGKA